VQQRRKRRISEEVIEEVSSDFAVDDDKIISQQYLRTSKDFSDTLKNHWRNCQEIRWQDFAK
jgi:predicted nucleic-acid-binding protein